MPRIIADRVMETSTSVGTGAFVLDAAVPGYRRFGAVCAVDDTLDYAIVAVDNDGVPTGEWETGRGTYSAANTLTRSTLYASSSGAAIAFAAGPKMVLHSENAASVGVLIEDAPQTGFRFVRQDGGWVALPPEPGKEYAPFIVNAAALPYFGIAAIPKPFTPTIGNLMVLFIANNNNYGASGGWVDYLHSGGNYADGVGFLWRYVDQAMVDAATISPCDRNIDTGVLFEINAQYIADPANPLAPFIKLKANADNTAGAYTPDVPSAIFYGVCSREGGINSTNPDAELVPPIQGYGGNRTCFAAQIPVAAAGVTEDLTFQYVGGGYGNAFVLMAPLQDPTVAVYVEDAPADGVQYGRKDNDWTPIVASGGGGAVAHKFWRLYYEYMDTRATYGEAVAELEMRATAGGPDQCNGGTPLARNWFQTNVPANAFDGNPNTWWIASGEGQGTNGSAASQYSGWLGYEFASPVTVAEVAVTARNDNGGAPQAPKDFKIEYSDDGVTWRTSFVGSVDGAWGQGETKVFTGPGGSDAGVGVTDIDFAAVVFTVGDGTGIITIDASHNVSSVERLSTTRYLVHFQTPAADRLKLVPSIEAKFPPYANKASLTVGLDRNTDQLSGLGITENAMVIIATDTQYELGQVFIRVGEVGRKAGGGEGGTSRKFVSQAVIGNGVATNWGEFTGNDGTPIPGYALTFTLDAPGVFKVTYNFAYQGNHGVRVKPQADGARIGAPILNGGWDFQTASTYESGTGWGFERSFIVPLAAGTHTLDCLYNAQSSTQQHILGQGFILAEEIAMSPGNVTSIGIY
jgi:hypothetical protein